MPIIPANLRTVVFVILLLLITGAFLYIIGGLLLPIFYGMVFAILLYPLYGRVLAGLRNKEGLAALISILLAIILLILVLYVIGSLLVRDAVLLIDTIGDKVDAVAPEAESLFDNAKNLLPDVVSERVSQINLREQIVSLTKNVAQVFLGFAQAFTGNLVAIFALSLVAFYATFYFLKNGKRWSARFIKVLPLPAGDAEYLSERFVTTVRTALRMIFIMGAVQGFLGGLIFAMLGITAPFFWGLIFALFSLIPGLGHYIVWLPTAIILFLIGSPIKAIILIVYGLLVMGFADDLLRPYLIGRSVNIHPFLILLATIGGIATFGFTGLILGPVVASLTVAVWSLYQNRYAS